jgi:hypothetical protein
VPEVVFAVFVACVFEASIGAVWGVAVVISGCGVVVAVAISGCGVAVAVAVSTEASSPLFWCFEEKGPSLLL